MSVAGFHQDPPEAAPSDYGSAVSNKKLQSTESFGRRWGANQVLQVSMIQLEGVRESFCAGIGVQDLVVGWPRAGHQLHAERLQVLGRRTPRPISPAA